MVITPAQLAKPDTEEAHQEALMCWVAVASRFGFNIANAWSLQNVELQTAKKTFPFSTGVSELDWLHHIPNGGARDKVTAGRMRAAGVKAGVWDLHLPVVRNGFAGLYIEMKKPGRLHERNGGLSEEQVYFGNFVEMQGYKTNVCYSWLEASAALMWYLDNSNR